MGVIDNVRSALAPSAVRQALRSSGSLGTPAILTPSTPRPLDAPRPRIGKKGPPLGDPIGNLPAASLYVEYSALEASPAKWFSTMVQGDYGHTGPMIDLFTDALDRDAHLRGETGKRVQSLMGRPILFRPPIGYEADREANQISQMVRRILLTESRKFRSMTSHLMAGPVFGYGVAPLRWTTNLEGEHVPHMRWEHLNRFAFEYGGQQRIGYYRGSYRSYLQVEALENYPDCFVAHVPMGGRTDYPWRRGPMRSCIIPSFLKRHGLQFWLVLCERFGMPQPYARVERGLVDHDGEATDDTVAETQKALQNLGRYWSAVFGKDVEIDSIPGSGNVRADVHRALIDWADMTMSICLLGQNLTTKVEGGSFAAAETHRAVAADLHIADSIELGETITQQIIEPMVRYNWPGAPVPSCEFSIGVRSPFDIKDVEAGICTPDEYRRTKGHEAMPDNRGADYRRPESVQVPEQIEAPESAAVPEETAAPPSAEVVAGEAIEVEPVSVTEATAKDPSTGLNGAQMSELKLALADVVSGALPAATVKQYLLASLPISEAQVDAMLAPLATKPAPVAPTHLPAAPEAP